MEQNNSNKALQEDYSFSQGVNFLREYAEIMRYALIIQGICNLEYCYMVNQAEDLAHALTCNVMSCLKNKDQKELTGILGDYRKKMFSLRAKAVEAMAEYGKGIE